MCPMSLTLRNSDSRRAFSLALHYACEGANAQTIEASAWKRHNKILTHIQYRRVTYRIGFPKLVSRHQTPIYRIRNRR
ncbi:hypothetical protein K1719_014361 [Acacia pycnantha]|nr:hypothetical protein K1719_014361 [Acacia pycnantha]